MRRLRLPTLLVTAVMAVSCAVVPGVLFAQDTPPPAPAATAPQAPQQRTPVTLGGQPVFYLLTDVGGYPAADRAAQIEERLRAIVSDRSIADVTVTMRDEENTTQLLVGGRLVVTVTEPDAQAVGVARALVARNWSQQIEQAIEAERVLYETPALVRAVILTLIATLLLVVAMWALRRLTRLGRVGLRRRLDHQIRKLRERGIDTRSARSVELLFEQTITVIGLSVALLLVDVYLTFSLGMFPWTRSFAGAMLGLLLAPLYATWRGLIAYLPSAFFLLVIAVITLYVIRFTKVFFDAIAIGRLKLENFPADWADPTFKTVRVVIIAFALVVAFPYLPGSESPAFAGIGVFAGILLSLASSSSLSNIIAGLVLIYTGAFRVGDRVRFGETLGVVIDRGLLATRLRTTKNEDVVVPNAIVLAGQTINYSAIAHTEGLIIHTAVTIGYDAPWRTVHELLIAAANATNDVEKTPPPFVLQTALNDFYVTYEINAYIRQVDKIIKAYSDLHANIQDKFFEAGVEIMSPHYSTLRDGNTVAMPEEYRPKGYEAPPFKIGGTLGGPGTKG